MHLNEYNVFGFDMDLGACVQEDAKQLVFPAELTESENSTDITCPASLCTDLIVWDKMDSWVAAIARAPI